MEQSYFKLNSPIVENSSLDFSVGASETHSQNQKRTIFSKDGIVLDSQRHVVRKNGVQVHIQRVDFALLEFLFRNPSTIFSSEELIKHVWFDSPTATRDGLRMSVSRLRTTLDTYDGRGSLIETVYRVGYRLRE